MAKPTKSCKLMIFSPKNCYVTKKIINLTWLCEQLHSLNKSLCKWTKFHFRPILEFWSTLHNFKVSNIEIRGEGKWSFIFGWQESSRSAKNILPIAWGQLFNIQWERGGGRGGRTASLSLLKFPLTLKCPESLFWIHYNSHPLFHTVFKCSIFGTCCTKLSFSDYNTEFQSEGLNQDSHTILVV